MLLCSKRPLYLYSLPSSTTIATKLLAKVRVPDCKLERAHRDGELVAGRERHILVKVSFYRDKARRALADKGYYIIDITATDVKEKRRRTTKVQAPYTSETKLRFMAGWWRSSYRNPLFCVCESVGLPATNRFFSSQGRILLSGSLCLLEKYIVFLL